MHLTVAALFPGVLVGFQQSVVLVALRRSLARLDCSQGITHDTPL